MPVVKEWTVATENRAQHDGYAKYVKGGTANRAGGFKSDSSDLERSPTSATDGPLSRLGTQTLTSPPIPPALIEPCIKAGTN